MRATALSISLLVTVVSPGSANAQATAARPASARYSAAQTSIGTLFADPSAKAAVGRAFPELIASPAVSRGMANRMTLRSLKRFRPKTFTDARLAALDAELAKLPVK